MAPRAASSGTPTPTPTPTPTLVAVLTFAGAGAEFSFLSLLFGMGETTWLVAVAFGVAVLAVEVVEREIWLKVKPEANAEPL